MLLNSNQIVHGMVSMCFRTQSTKEREHEEHKIEEITGEIRPERFTYAIRKPKELTITGSLLELKEKVKIDFTEASKKLNEKKKIVGFKGYVIKKKRLPYVYAFLYDGERYYRDVTQKEILSILKITKSTFTANKGKKAFYVQNCILSSVEEIEERQFLSVMSYYAKEDNGRFHFGPLPYLLKIMGDDRSSKNIFTKIKRENYLETPRGIIYSRGEKE